MSKQHQPSAAHLPQLLNTKQAAQALGCSKSTLDHLHIKGTGPRCYMISGRRMYDAVDLRMWLDARAVTSSSDAIQRGLSRPAPATAGGASDTAEG